MVLAGAGRALLFDGKRLAVSRPPPGERAPHVFISPWGAVHAYLFDHHADS